MIAKDTRDSLIWNEWSNSKETMINGLWGLHRLGNTTSTSGWTMIVMTGYCQNYKYRILQPNLEANIIDIKKDTTLALKHYVCWCTHKLFDTCNSIKNWWHKIQTEPPIFNNWNKQEAKHERRDRVAWRDTLINNTSSEIRYIVTSDLLHNIQCLACGSV